MVVLSARKLTKSFHNPHEIKILSGIDLDVSLGEAVAITGRSGQGKTTLLQILGTLDQADSGSLKIMDQTASFFNRSRLRNRHIAFVFQSFYLLEDYSALDNVLMPARIARDPIGPGSQAYQRAVALFERFEIRGRMDHPAKLLSGGEKQRVAIARALCNNPSILFADEPSGNLDRETASFIHEFLLDLVRKENKALILVTHDQSLASLCDRKLLLENGQISN